ncbi:MAG: Mut7-C RNAse domain-containing protein [Desulfobacterales bacterium]|jgi:uncharacterized protein with PIN domain
MAASGDPQSGPHCFLAESTLGKLAKWLRLLGFDTRYHSGPGFEKVAAVSEPQRIVLTRTQETARTLAGRPLIFIRENDPFEQVREVVTGLGLRKGDLRPFSRCLLCNRPTVPATREAVRGQVPDHVLQTASRFTVCAGCRKVYWPGTHTERAMDRIRLLFGAQAFGR